MLALSPFKSEATGNDIRQNWCIWAAKGQSSAITYPRWWTGLSAGIKGQQQDMGWQTLSFEDEIQAPTTNTSFQQYAVGLTRSCIRKGMCTETLNQKAFVALPELKKNKQKTGYISATPSSPIQYFTSTQDNGYSIKLIWAGAWKSAGFKGIW